jgi:hypothetical protein
MKTGLVTKWIHVPRAWIVRLVRPKQWKRDMTLRKLDVLSLYRSGSRTTVARELARYKLELAGVQEVRWEKGAR